MALADAAVHAFHTAASPLGWQPHARQDATDTDTVIKDVGGTGTFTFGPTLAKIVVNNVGSLALTGTDANAPNAPSAALTSLSVKRVDGNHPQAATANMQTGRYWQITPSDRASGYNVDLTLPTTFTPDGNDKLCRFTGSGWDCAASGFDAGVMQSQPYSEPDL